MGGNYGARFIKGETNEYENAGYRVSGIGDVNGDGIGDFAVTAQEGRNEYSNETGSVYVVFGQEEAELTLNLEDLDGTNGFEITSDTQVSDYSYRSVFGSTVVGLGDVNGDGYADFGIVENTTDFVSTGSYYGYYGYYGGDYVPGEGVAYVIFGGQDFSGASHEVDDLDHVRFDANGEIIDMVNLGDLNGDGFSDFGLVETQRYESTSFNRVYVYDANDNGVYDYDPDTNPDEYIAWTQYYDTSVDNVTSHVIFGTDEEATAFDPIANEGGSSVIVDLADVDGDGGFKVDLGQILGGYGFYGEFGLALSEFDSGSVGGYGYYEDSGAELSGAVDLNGDGFDDLVSRRGYVDVYGEGTSYYFRGPDDDGYTGDAYDYSGYFAYASNPVVTDSYSGTDVDVYVQSFDEGQDNVTAGLGNFSGDDAPEELAVLGFASDSDFSQIPTRFAVDGVYVLNGRNDIFDDGFITLDADAVNDGDASFFYSYQTYVDGDGEERTSWFDIEVILGVGDASGDGIDDMLIAGTRYNVENGFHIEAYLVLGTEESRSGVFSLEDLLASDGAYVYATDRIYYDDPLVFAAAGDVNGDGIADILVGDANGEDGDGEAIVIHGGIDAAEAADNADGEDDNIIAVENLNVDVDTGLVPIEISIEQGYRNVLEGDSSPVDVVFTLTRTGDLTSEVTVDFQVEGGSNGYLNYFTDAAAEDFEGGAFPSGTVTFESGSDTALLTIQIAGDLVDESSEDFSVVLSNPTTDNAAPVVIDEGRGSGYINDNDAPVYLRIYNSYVTEGDPGDDVVMSFQVSRSGKTDTAVSVDYVVSPYSSATYTIENEDIEGTLPLTGTLTFAAGETFAYIQVPINEDDLIEGTEYMEVTLSNAVADTGNTQISDGYAIGTLYDDDFPVQFAVNNTSATETDDSDVEMSFTITRSGDTTVAATVDYRLESSSASADDFSDGFIDPDTGLPYEGTLEFAAGETTKTVTMQIAPDNVTEGTERVDIILSNPTAESSDAPEIIDGRGNGFIYDDDLPVAFRTSDASVTEGDPGTDRTLTFTIIRSGPTDVEGTVDFSLEAYDGSNSADADDFVSGFPQSGTLTFGAGETQKTVTAVVSGDNEIEGTEYVQIVLSNPTAVGENAQITSGTRYGYIYNDDHPVVFSASGATVTEGDEGETTEMVFVVYRSGETSVAATLDYAVGTYSSSQEADADDLATDFPTSGTVSFAVGETRKEIVVQVQGDNTQESDEFFQIVFSNPDADGVATRLDTGSVLGRINNDDVPVNFYTGSASVTEGQGGALTPLTFTIYRNGETDVAASVDYELTPFADALLTAESPDFQGGLPRTGTVEFAAGETSKTVSFQVRDDEVFEELEYVEFRLSNPSAPDNPQGATANTGVNYGYIYDDEKPVDFRVFGATTTEKDPGETSTLQFLIQRSGDTSIAASIDYKVSTYPYSGATDADVDGTLPMSGTVSFAAGETQKFVDVTVLGDDAFEGTEYLQIDISNPVADDPDAVTRITTSRNYGYINDDDVPTYFRVYGYSAVEGDSGDTNTVSFLVSRTGDTSAAASVDYNIAGGTANAADFDSSWPTSGTLSFAAGETSKTVTLQIAGDEDVEGDEYTYMTLSNPVSDDAGIEARLSNSSAYAVITNDDFPAYIQVNYSSYIYEGDPGDANVLSFTLTRSGDTSSSVSVDYTFAGDSYTPLGADDFEGGLPQSGTVTFAAGQTSKTVSFAVLEDEEIEGNERGRLTISNPTIISGDAEATAQITRAIGYGIVYNDDFAPSIQMLANGSQWGTSVNEGNSGYTDVILTFVREGDTDGDVTVNFDLQTNVGSVFAADSNDIEGFLPGVGKSVTILDGETTATYTVRINGDGIIEANESFWAQITSVNAAPGKSYDLKNSSTSITIRNDDGRPPIPELPFDVDGDGVIEPGEFIRVEADVFGDPHIVTLDGLGYDFQAVGEYVLVETVDGVDNPFSVQVRFEAFPGSDLVSVTTRMAVEVKGKVVEVDAHSPDAPLLVDGVAVSLDDAKFAGIDLDDDDSNARDIFAIDDGKFFIKLNDGGDLLMVGMLDGALNVCVFLADPAAGGNAGQVRGLMGNANQDLTDDFGLRDGSELPDGVQSFDDDGVPSLTFDYIYGFGDWEGNSYRDSWALDDGEALFSGETPEYPEGFPAAPLKLENLPESVQAAARQAAIEAGLDPDEDPVIFESAVLDFALTGMGAFLGGATQLAATPQAATTATEAPDVAPTVSVTANTSAITEGDEGVQTVSYTFYRIGDATGALEVSYEIGGDVDAADLGDDTPLSGVITFDDGEEEVTLDVIVKGDLATEDSEALTVSITGTNNDGVLIGGAQGETTIVTDDFGPEAQDDAKTGNAGVDITGNLLDDNGLGEDSDADGDTLSVTRVFIGGVAYAVADGTITLADGRELTVEEDGDFSFDPNGFYSDLELGGVETFSFDYEVSDGNGGVDEATVTLSIKGTASPNAAPVAVDDEYEIDEDTPTYFFFTENDRDDDRDELEVEIKQGPTKGTLNFDGEGWIYTPDQDYNGEDSFTYEISDGNGGVDDATVSIDIRPVNDGPDVEGETLETDEDSAGSINLLDNDDDVDGDALSIIGAKLSDGTSIALGSEVTLDGLGTITINTDGGVVYDPAGQLEALGFNPQPEPPAESFTISYEVSDGTLSETATLTVDVRGVNDAPELDAAGPFTIDENTTEVGTLSASDVEGDGLTFSVIGGEDGDLFEIDATTGLLSFKTAPDFEAPSGDDNSYEVQVQVSDGTLNDDTFVFVNVADVDETPDPVLIEGGSDAQIFGSDADEIIKPNAGAMKTVAGGGGADVFDFSDTVHNGAREFRTILDYSVGEDAIELGDGSVIHHVAAGGRVLLFTDQDFDVITVVGATSFDDISFI
ncbi:Calx-beta domain-containing protein [Poseidonocella sedimentorum]|uniref:Calx-beta domain-containing protein n=1 Tax=Poseidonocella sedimentorum TaxID=871652 RepID=A0A1I6DXQ7_9RHOB|nr:Calx-beta domain-containing protein [Poseidonocella sedimentorum]SFR10206.1 Calx-beta domain-containing protein [Poseidonocella sedimentorum]